MSTDGDLFKSVNTAFKTLNRVEDHTTVVITGTAEFSRNREPLSFVSAGDVYEFDDRNRLLKITSYCIPSKL